MQTVNLSPGMENREFNSEGYLETHFDTRGDPYMAMIAESDNLLNIYYHLRYEVFCEERRFIAPRADLLDKVESDNHTIHLLLYHQELDLFVGGVRMILPQTEYPFNALPAIELDDSPFHQQFIDHTLYVPRSDYHGNFKTLNL
ncbi:GNAT family N-acyltransferase [Candidatus Paracaedibacter symbiosus]|uniref:GNAT family N-acyltransferase n=1 Tax=Candidatus Paracaedibacter symbiosus TaxID=244582 RepID=UPI0018DBEAA8|nr:GNAT family N-acyltransferase [Candidatus Paracaedibacter symbiosus]